ncbi:SRPBCC domain-containing protein [Scytonema sp. UIC 10036]|uniref:SRPBCC family protein n=1 Tax=Scytonema sp. UIC 10036 TaxID=2304196 RepID=UPI0012DAA99B|nr:SRPBCC domain-containing protein [Scytonema sp. UIC 10036]MUH00778.1 SRPBCC domain-containing protein [Scytonema sp. UIC 10036]
MLRDLKKEIFYPYPPEKVWQVLTNRSTLAAWLMENDFEPRVGHKFQFQDYTLPGLSESIHCEVIELDEPNRLSYTWQDKFMSRPSIVTWILEPQEGGTQLRLEHKILQSLPTESQQPKYSHISGLNHRYGTTALAYAPETRTQELRERIPMFNGAIVTNTNTSVILTSFLGSRWEYKLESVVPQVLGKGVRG